MLFKPNLSNDDLMIWVIKWTGELFRIQLHVRGGHASLLIEAVGRILQVQGEVREGGQSPAEDHRCGQVSARTHIGITLNLTPTGE